MKVSSLHPYDFIFLKYTLLTETGWSALSSVLTVEEIIQLNSQIRQLTQMERTSRTRARIGKLPTGDLKVLKAHLAHRMNTVFIESELISLDFINSLSYKLSKL